MTAREQAEQLWTNLIKLGPRRLFLLGIVGLTIFAVTGLGGYYLSRPSLETLYSGLDRQDVSRIADVLREANIGFDINADGTTVLVHYGSAAQARMLLAEKGLPNGTNAGNELFDKLGSLGLTSFMQEITKVRALEGELARTIQLMRGVRAARVHIVMPDEGSFRRTPQPPSASVVIRTDSDDDATTARAIRHLVAAAIPGMKLNEVTVLNTDGVLLASGDDLADAAPGRMLSLEKSVSQDIINNVRKTLVPYLGLRNFQISVATRLNTDKKQTNETTYDPDSRVERSVKVTKQSQVSQNSTNQTPATVQQNIPQQNTTSQDGKQSNDETNKREELTNYEISTKTVTTVSGGFSIDSLSVAVLVNKSALASALGDKATPDAVKKQIADLQQIVASAAGARTDRGDTVKIAAVDFVDAGRDLQPVPPPAWTELLMRQSGNVINAGTILIVAILLVWFGLRPATKALLARPESAEAPGLLGFASDPNFALPEPLPEFVPELQHSEEANLIEDLTNNAKRTPQKRLEQIVEFDEEQAAAILKQWMHLGEAA